jgi:hypothetical protein
MKRFSIAGLVALILCLSLSLNQRLGAQFVSDFDTVSVNTDGSLRAPVTFFTANSNRLFAIIGTSNLIADLAAKAGLTNAAMVTPVISGASLTGTTTVLSNQSLYIANGGAISGASGSIMAFPEFLVLKHPTNVAFQGAITKGYVDYQAVKFVNTLTELLAVDVAVFLPRFAYVRNNTAGDGAAGLWIWDFSATGTDTPTYKTSSVFGPGSTGRWIKLN